MLQSKYITEDPLEVSKKLKEKLLKKPVDDEAPSTEELDTEIQGNKPAITKELADKSEKAKELASGYKLSGGLETPSYVEPKTATERTVGNKIADGAVAGAGGLLDMASTVALQKGPMTKKEQNANTMNLGAKGAQTGAAIGTAIGGPFGGLIGAGAGLVAGVGTGLIQGIGDKKELEDKAKLERITYLDDVKDKRKKAQKLSEGETVLSDKKNVLEKQMGILGSKYSTSKIG